MATTIVTKNGSGAPTASDLVAGELAVDLTNKRLYTEDSGGTVLELGTNPASNVTFGDNTKAIFGTGSDLQIYHDGSASYIKDAGTGNLNIQTDGVGVVIEHTDGTNLAVFNAGDGTASLYHSGNLKLATTASGIDVTGSVTADGLTVDGAATITANLDVGADNGLGGKLSIQTSSYGVLQDMRTLVAGGINPYLTISSSADGITFEENGSQYKSLMFKTGATERMRIDASGNVGIGCIPDTALNAFGYKVLEVAGANTTKSGAILLSNSSGTDFGQIYADSTDGWKFVNGQTTKSTIFYGGSGTSEQMRIGSSGTVKISHADTASEGLRVIQTTAARTSGGALGLFYDDQAGTTQPTLVAQQNGTGDILQLFDGGSQVVTVKDGGNLLVGTTDTTLYNNTSGGGAAFMVVGDGIRLDLARDGDVATFNRMSGTGTLLEMRQGGAVVGTVTVTASTTAYNTSSDQRLKENIADADDAGSKIDAIQVRKFDWKVDGSHQDYGMVAQELLEVVPEAVSGDAESEEMMGVDYSKLVPMMLKEIQSLRARIAALES
jgi:hypothetical protein